MRTIHRTKSILFSNESLWNVPSRAISSQDYIFECLDGITLPLLLVLTARLSSLCLRLVLRVKCKRLREIDLSRFDELGLVVDLLTASAGRCVYIIRV